MLLDVKQSKTGDAFVITDPNGGVHACTTPEHLWKALDTVLKDPEIPEAESIPYRGGSGNGSVTDQQADDILAHYATRAVEGVLGGLRRASYHGKGKKKAESKEGDGR